MFEAPYAREAQEVVIEGEGRMTRPDKPGSQNLDASERRRLLEEIRARLSAIGNSLADFRIDAAELRYDATELGAVIQRIQWIADVSAPAPSEIRPVRFLDS
jgi:hypothetical protein